MLKGLARFSYRLLGRIVFRYREHFTHLIEDLKKARLPYTMDEYVSLAILLSIVTFLVSYPIIVAVLGNVSVLTIILGFILSSAVSLLVLLNFLNYPKLVARNRAYDIESLLPYALTHMATLAGSGIPPHHVFRIMGKIERYGEISKECGIIYKDVSVLGKDLFTALSDAAKASPSRIWTEVLWGISSTLRSGGSLREYLYNKSRELQTLLERKEKEAVETMNLLTDIYLILFVLSPILAAVIIMLTSMLAGGTILGIPPMTLFGLLVYIVMPVIGFVFLLVADNIRPREVV